MRTDRRLLTRWVLAVAAVLGLLAMHGLTASTASAAADCGDMPVASHAVAHHLHAGDPAMQHAAPIGVATMGVDLAGSDSAHTGMLCAAILLMAIVLGLMIRNTRREQPIRVRERNAGRPTRSVRAPPDHDDLSVWRN